MSAAEKRGSEPQVPAPLTAGQAAPTATLVEKAHEILADYDAGRSLQVKGHGWLVRFAAAIAEPEGPLDCPGVKGMPFTHLFVSHGRKAAYCARCGLLEAEYKPSRSLS